MVTVGLVTESVVGDLFPAKRRVLLVRGLFLGLVLGFGMEIVRLMMKAQRISIHYSAVLVVVFFCGCTVTVLRLYSGCNVTAP